MAELKGGGLVTDMSDKTVAESTRSELLEAEPYQWPILLSNASGACLRYYGFKTLAEFVKAPVSQNGLSMTLDRAKYLLNYNPKYQNKAAELIAKLELGERVKGVEAVKENGVRGKSYNNPTNVIANDDATPKPAPRQGNSIEYRAAKLKRDHPAIAKRLEEGEFKNVADAERAAGVKAPRRVQVGKFTLFDDTYGPTEFAADLRERVRPEFLACIIDELNKA